MVAPNILLARVRCASHRTSTHARRARGPICNLRGSFVSSERRLSGGAVRDGQRACVSTLDTGGEEKPGRARTSLISTSTHAHAHVHALVCQLSMYSVQHRSRQENPTRKTRGPSKTEKKLHTHRASFTPGLRLRSTAAARASHRSRPRGGSPSLRPTDATEASPDRLSSSSFSSCARQPTVWFRCSLRWRANRYSSWRASSPTSCSRSSSRCPRLSKGASEWGRR